MSDDGNTIAVSATSEDSAATGINSDGNDNSSDSSGAAYVFSRVGTVWSEQAYIKASNTGAADQFGNGLALSGDGNRLAVGARLEDSDATGIDGDQNNDNFDGAGAVYLFSRDGGGVWSQQSYIKASNTGINDQFGLSVVLSPNGGMLAVGATNEASAATGINGDQSNNNAAGAGAVYVYD